MTKKKSSTSTSEVESISTTTTSTTTTSTTTTTTTTKPPIRKYKYTMYTPQGKLRAKVSAETMYLVNMQYKDVVQALIVDKWLTLDQILERYSLVERRNPRHIKRSSSDIESILDYLSSRGILEEKLF